MNTNEYINLKYPDGKEIGEISFKNTDILDRIELLNILNELKLKVIASETDDNKYYFDTTNIKDTTKAFYLLYKRIIINSLDRTVKLNIDYDKFNYPELHIKACTFNIALECKYLGELN